MKKNDNLFSLKNKNILITGGGGFLAKSFISSILDFGGNPILIDISKTKINSNLKYIKKKYSLNLKSYVCDLTNESEVRKTFNLIIKSIGIPDSLINNAAFNPEFMKNFKKNYNLDTFDINDWNSELNAGLTSAFLCTKYFGKIKSKKHRSILNISSDLGIIAPNQSIYKTKNKVNYKPVTYSVIKHGIIGLTKYTATFLNKRNIRCNAIAFGGVLNNQDKIFLKKISSLIPLGRLANKNEYNSTIIFLLSDSSSYMTGSVLVVDGGRTVW